MRRTAFLFVLGVFGLAGGLVAAAYADGLPGLPVTTALPVSVTTVPVPPPPTTTAVAVTTPVVTATVTVATPTPPPSPAPPPPPAIVTTVAAALPAPPLPAVPLPAAPPAVAHTVTAVTAAATAATAAVRSAVPAAPDPVTVTTPPATAPAAPAPATARAVAEPLRAIQPARVLRAAPVQTVAGRLPALRPRRILRAATLPSPTAAHPAVDAVLESPLARLLTRPAPSGTTAARPAAARDSGLSPAGGLAVAIALAAIGAAAVARSSGVLAHCATVGQATFPTFSIFRCKSEPPPGSSPLVRGAGKAPPPASGVSGTHVTVEPGVRGAGSVLSLPQRVGRAALHNRGVRAVEIILLALVATANVALVAIRARVGRLQHR